MTSPNTPTTSQKPAAGPSAADSEKCLGPFKGWQSDDGYRVERSSTGGLLNPEWIFLDVVAQYGGEYTEPAGAGRSSAPAHAWHQPTRVELGASIRLERALSAICEYFNNGGTWLELDGAMQAVRHVVPGGLVFPGFFYQTTEVNEEGDAEHIFSRTDGFGPSVVWTEGLLGDIEPRWLEGDIGARPSAGIAEVLDQDDSQLPQLPGGDPAD